MAGFRRTRTQIITELSGMTTKPETPKSFEDQVKEYYENKIDLSSIDMPVIASEMPEKRGKPYPGRAHKFSSKEGL